jgi:hypothetical protein
LEPPETAVGLDVGSAEGLGVVDAIGVEVGDAVGLGVAVGLGTLVRVTVAVAVAVGVDDWVAVAVRVRVAVGEAAVRVIMPAALFQEYSEAQAGAKMPVRIVYVPNEAVAGVASVIV